MKTVKNNSIWKERRIHMLRQMNTVDSNDIWLEHQNQSKFNTAVNINNWIYPVVDIHSGVKFTL